MNGTPPCCIICSMGVFSMKEYDVVFDGNAVGKVLVRCEGLYTRIQCTCRLPDDRFYRLLMICGEQTTDLGILVPEQSQFSVNKCIKSKYLADGAKLFKIVPASHDVSNSFIPVSSQMPFPYISALERAKLCRQADGFGIIIDD